MLTKIFKFSAAAIMAAGVVVQSANAAEILRPKHQHLVRDRVLRFEDACGCWHVTWVYHRELWYTYGWGFDPRTYDMTEPHFYHGAVKAYPRYW
jgi:hypothetical protein